ncbi:hypothetical protein SAMN04488112_106125 [Melghirimyces thermohalophilus]|uniref:Uncharacterized protein n=1 Tax=Melghirimyces thermohalophilus TaxID=1236220 RepID=A0A1G6KRH6_9BACL|nr:hypothetical protein SAMN04488112_106125 [Melghirimyces thermohalophilus]
MMSSAGRSSAKGIDPTELLFFLLLLNPLINTLVFIDGGDHPIIELIQL